MKSKPADIGLVAVASNNLVTLNKDQNIFDSKKKIKAATADGMEHKLTSVHRAAIARNNALLAMYTNQVDLCKTLINDLAGSFEKHYDQDNRDLIVAGTCLIGCNIFQIFFPNTLGKRTVQSRFSNTLFSDKSRFSDYFAEDHFFST